MSQTSPRAARVPEDEARRRILEAARALLLTRPFADLSVGAVMREAGLARTVFWRHYPDLPQMAADLLPDADAPLIDRITAIGDAPPAELVRAIVEGLVETYAAHGPLLQAIDDAARHDAAVAQHLDSALVGPRQLLARLVADAPHPPPDPAETARLLMATHRAYLLDTFGSGRPRRGARRHATEALLALWERLLA
ncbi:TetR/AcrR family transcriptional regulator [Conexibacter woesei]|uniref:Transcriptional regulator, TetR family n=1 Tax=Conexibacter woesei (strain DSM 14684 / CCUG 47730 / CIP 108061 / JCM 11494 / NBRC 100937 / ID131577) TaxID=469383 RepID=D3FD36_CONWI|nr:TetR/AcrR family transcriptional regulator [Conexibacter woesei]ADB51548.1 transcriptional regulator, TetR family [Conexibacter woesei DSM 14684]